MQRARRASRRAATAAPVLIAGLVVLLASAAWRGGPAGAQSPAGRVAGTAAARYVDRVQLMRDVTSLASPAFEGRRAGTEGGQKARAWIARQFASIGLAPLDGARFEQPFTVEARDADGRPFRPSYPTANLVGRIEGRQPRAGAIVITAHYDHLGVHEGVLYPGADDNASGVAALLAAARYFQAARPRHPLILAALDAEELGQHGAKALIASGQLPLASIALNINLDMVSRSAAREVYAAGTSYSPWQVPILRQVQSRSAVRILFGHDRPAPASGGREDWTHASDHGPFHDAGLPFVYFGVEDHADYHRPTDTADRIEPDFFGAAADMIIEAIRAFDARLN